MSIHTMPATRVCVLPVGAGGTMVRPSESVVGCCAAAKAARASRDESSVVSSLFSAMVTRMTSSVRGLTATAARRSTSPMTVTPP